MSLVVIVNAVTDDTTHDLMTVAKRITFLDKFIRYYVAVFYVVSLCVLSSHNSMVFQGDD